MTQDVLELAEQLWTGEVDIVSVHPVGGYIGGLCEPRQGVGFVPSFANVSAFTTDDGLALVDTGSSFVASAVHEAIRGWSSLRLDTAIYSHGHIDHVFGVGVFEEEAASKRWAAPVVVAHDALPAALRPVHRDSRLQQRDQPAAVQRARSHVADAVPVPGPHVPGPSGARRRRPAPRASPCAWRDRRPHLDVGAGPARAVLRRPVHLGLAQRRESSEGPALPRRVGRSPAGDDRPLPGDPPPRSRVPGHRRAESPPGPDRHAPSCSNRSSSRPWPS